MATTSPPARAEPCAAERVRSIVAAADSLNVITDDARAHLIGRHTVDDTGALTLHLPADSRPALAATHAPGGGLVTRVEFTDLAPTAMRNRVRAQVDIHATLRPVGQRHTADADPAGTLTARVQPGCAQLIQHTTYTLVGAADLTAAAPDPLATHEAALLTHLADAHPDTIDLLTRLVPIRLLQGVRRVHPLHLDRYGIVLRLEHPHEDHDVRLPFDQPLHRPGHAGAYIRALLHRARGCRRRRLHPNGC